MDVFFRPRRPDASPLKLLQDLTARRETISLAADAYTGDVSMSKCVRMMLVRVAHAL